MTPDRQHSDFAWLTLLPAQPARLAARDLTELPAEHLANRPSGTRSARSDALTPVAVPQSCSRLHSSPALIGDGADIPRRRGCVALSRPSSERSRAE